VSDSNRANKIYLVFDRIRKFINKFTELDFMGAFIALITKNMLNYSKKQLSQKIEFIVRNQMCLCEVSSDIINQLRTC